MANFKTPNIITCCIDCKNRHFKCHSDCELYKQQKKKYEELKEKNKKEKIPDSVYRETEERVIRAKRAKGLKY